MLDIFTFISDNSVLSAIVSGLIVAAIVGAVKLIRVFRDQNRMEGHSLVVKGDGNLINIVDAEALSLFSLRDSPGEEDSAWNDSDFFGSKEGLSYRTYLHAFEDELLISTGCDNYAHPLGLSFDMDSYIVHLKVNYYLKDDTSAFKVSVYEEEENVAKIGILQGSLILGQQMFDDGADFWECCDSCSGDLEAVASDVLAAGLLMSEKGRYRNILYIDSIQLSSKVIEGEGIRIVFDTIPQVIFEEYHVKPDLLCYLIATSNGYYEREEERAELDPRSVDKGSPLLYIENGFSMVSGKGGLGKTLYRITEDIELPII